MIGQSRKVVPKYGGFDRNTAQGILKLRAYQKDKTRAELAILCGCSVQYMNLMLGRRPEYLTPKYISRLCKILSDSTTETQLVYYLAARAAGYHTGKFTPTEKRNAEAQECTV